MDVAVALFLHPARVGDLPSLVLDLKLYKFKYMLSKHLIYIYYIGQYLAHPADCPAPATEHFDGVRSQGTHADLVLHNILYDILHNAVTYIII